MYLSQFLRELNRVTDGCQPNMHEPDEQNLTAVVKGDHLDNAMGNEPDTNAGEFTVGLSRDGGQTYEYFNLATLIALARMAKLND